MSTAGLGRGSALAEKLGLTIIGTEGHDLVGPCIACKSSDAFRIHQETGVAYCYSCKGEWNAWDVAFSKLGSRVDCMGLLVGLGLRTPNDRQAADTSLDDQLFAAIARIKRVSVDAIKKFGATAWVKKNKLILPQWGSDALAAVKEQRKPEPCTKYFVDLQGVGKNKKGGNTGVFLHGRFPEPGDRVAICEGPFEAAALLSRCLGREYDIIVGLPGSSLKRDFVAWFTGCDVDHFPDRDAGGDKGSALTGRRLHGTVRRFRIVRVPLEWQKSDGPGVRDLLATPNGEQLLRDTITAAQAWVPDETIDPDEDGEGTNVYALTDMGNAERFAFRNCGSVGYCYAWNSFLIYDGRRWEVDQVGAVVQRAKSTVRDILREAISAESDSERDAIIEHSRRSEAASRIAAMLKLSQDELPLRHEQLDRNPWAFNCKNGTIDLQTGVLKKHDRGDFITKYCPTPYIPDATSQVWEKFLSAVFNNNQELIGFVQRLSGYFLTGDVSEQILPIYKGTGSNGKSTLIEAFASAIGQDYCLKAVSNLLIAKKHESHPTEKADLFGKRFVYCVETSDGNRLDEALVKELTGGDKVRARRMRENFWEFDPTHKLILCTNHAPRVRDTGHAMWRRLVLLPFDVQFWNPAAGEKGEPHLKQDKTLASRLRAEAPGILAWAVRGCLEWQKYGLQIPETVRLETETYRDSQDLLTQFIDNCCEVDDRNVVSSSYAFKAYRHWTNDQVMTQKKFSEQMESRGYEKKKNSGMWFIGIRVLDGILPEAKAAETDKESENGK